MVEALSLKEQALMRRVIAEHRRYGELSGDVSGPTVWLACDCGAVMAQRDGPDCDGGSVDDVTSGILIQLLSQRLHKERVVGTSTVMANPLLYSEAMPNDNALSGIADQFLRRPEHAS
jgi:hypothetical protein